MSDDAIVLTKRETCKCGKTLCVSDSGDKYWLKKDVLYKDHDTKEEAEGTFLIKPRQDIKLIKQ